ncbi:unnamed protein product [Brassicogethes aeneus]|uniref:Uncharacterized protein n=1 Tax=Brassicogethes aeneus TaxID=1431903 RepID=A0A9P0B124_BRAAE|nr:unnamed protein product [Brassicogethes aeneus]
MKLTLKKQGTKRTIREAIEKEKRPRNLNTRDDTQRLLTAWKPALTNTKTPRRLARSTEPNITQLQSQPEVKNRPWVYKQRSVATELTPRQTRTRAPTAAQQIRPEDGTLDCTETSSNIRFF